MSIDLQTFIQKAREKENKKLKIAEIEIKDFGMVEFTRPTDVQIMNFMTKITNGNKDDMKEMTDISKEFVYMSCPMLQNKELQDEFDIKLPFETPVTLFGFMETIFLANKIMEKFNGNLVIEDTDEIIKN